MWCLTAECMDVVAGGWLELALIIIHAGAARQSSARPCKDAGAIAVRLVGTAVLRGCRRAPRPRLGRRLRVDLIVQSNLADRPGLAGHRGGRRVVWGGSGEPLTTRSKQSQAHQSWNYPKPLLICCEIECERWLNEKRKTNTKDR